MRPYETNPYLFAQRFQSGKTLDDLFAGAERRQQELKDNVEKIAPAFGTRIQVITPAIKLRERAAQKLATVFKHTADAAQLSDITRLTVVLESPEMAEEFKTRLQTYYSDMCDTGWQITPALRLDRTICVAKDGFISQILLKGPQQYIATEKCRKIFEVSRLMVGDGRKFDPSDVTDTMRERIKTDYNNLAEQQDFAPYIASKESVADFSGDALYQRYLDLIHAQQAIRLASVEKSSPEWQELYVPMILHVNASLPPDRQLDAAQLKTLPQFPCKSGNHYV